jgi:hypothetical protein
MKSKNRSLRDAAEDLVGAVGSDCGAFVDLEDMMHALEQDCEGGAPIPTEEEVEWLVMGKEEEPGGDCLPPEYLMDRYPHVQEILTNIYC